jgi:hypothetical protein
MYSDQDQDERWLEALAGRIAPDAQSFELEQATAIRTALLKRRDEIEAEEARLNPDKLNLIKASLIKEGFLVERKSGFIDRVAGFFKAGVQAEKKSKGVKKNSADRRSRPDQNIGPIYPPLAVPSVWRNNRSMQESKVDSLAAGGLDDLEIPAFLRRQAGDQDSRPPVIKPTGVRPTSEDSTGSLPKIETADFRKIPWVEVLPQLENLMRDFEIAAASSPNFRISLIKTLRGKNTSYIMWLWHAHVRAIGSSAPIWAIFIFWLHEKSEFHLSESAKRQVLDVMGPLDKGVVGAVLDDLNRSLTPSSWPQK